MNSYKNAELNKHNAIKYKSYDIDKLHRQVKGCVIITGNSGEAKR